LEYFKVALMPIIKLLLIEDNPRDATLFCDQLQQELSGNVEIEWKTRLDDALYWLESCTAAQKPDQIWLDPGLPDLAQGSIGKALSSLKSHVPTGELRMLSSLASPVARAQAAENQVPVVSKNQLIDSGNSQILEIVREMLYKRSSGSTVSIANAKLEGKIATLEVKMDIFSRQVETNTPRIERTEANAQELSRRVSELATELASLKKSIADQKELNQQMIAKRIDARMTIATSIFTLIGLLGAAFMSNVAPKLLDKLAAPSAIASPSGR
jgi:hypothetical protein